MRQFKFRAWHKESKLMTDFSFSSLMGDSSNGEVYLYIRDEKKAYSPKIGSEQLIIMQYLDGDCKDCDGVEVCEDDIILVKDFFPEETCFENFIGIVKYSNHSYKLVNIYDTNEEIEFDDFCIEHEKILGNIHQNPELLNENR